jgi:putative DNA primase/helicase
VYKTEEDVRAAFDGESNIGVVMGEASGGMVDIDVDEPRAAAFAMAWMPPTKWVFSRNATQSVHFIYRVDNKAELPATARFGMTRGRPFCEVRTTGAQTMFPPSIHPDGESVVWLEREGGNGQGPGVVSGKALLARVRVFAAAAALGTSWPAEGSRHDAAVALCGGLARAGWREEEIVEMVRLVCSIAGEEEAEIRTDRLTAARSSIRAMEAGRQITGWKRLRDLLGGAAADELIRRVCEWLGLGSASGVAVEGVGALFNDELTEMGNAERLAAENSEDLRYCKENGQWYAWNGVIWTTAGDMVVLEKAADVARAVGSEALGLGGDPARRKAMLRHAEKSLTGRSLGMVITLAQKIPSVRVRISELDFDPWAFSCANGVIDLRTGELRPHVRADFITHQSPVVYDPEARSDLWDRFLETSTAGDKDLQAFLQRAVGYSLTGSAEEEKLFFIHGQAATGKSTFIAAVKAIMGDYGATADFETFLKKPTSSGGGPRSDIARLKGARFVSSVEVDRGREMAEGLVKQLTGGDAITVRHLYKEEFEFDPQFKLWLSANHAPAISGDDEAMWRRVLFVPFESVVPVERRDPRVKRELRNPASEASRAVLAWAVAGCREWLARGLGTARVVVEATVEQREVMDTVGQFLGECLEVFAEGEPGGDVRVEPAVLLAAYNGWLQERGYRPVSQRTFGERVGVRLRKEKKGGVVRYVGVKLRPYGFVGDVAGGEGVVHF